MFASVVLREWSSKKDGELRRNKERSGSEDSKVLYHPHVFQPNDEDQRESKERVTSPQDGSPMEFGNRHYDHQRRGHTNGNLKAHH
jgi:hypothetical protein